MKNFVVCFALTETLWPGMTKCLSRLRVGSEVGAAGGMDCNGFIRSTSGHTVTGVAGGQPSVSTCGSPDGRTESGALL